MKIVFDSDNTMGLHGCDVDDGLALLYAVGHAVQRGLDPSARIEAVCSSYGNNTLQAVHENTRRILDDWGLSLPLYRGAAGPVAPTGGAGIWGMNAADGEGPDIIVADALRRNKGVSPRRAEQDDASRLADDEAGVVDAAHAAGDGSGFSEAPEVSEAACYLARAARDASGELSLAVTGSTTDLSGALLLDPQALSRYRQVVFMGGVTETLVVGDRIMNELNLSCDPLATKAAFEAADQGARIVVITANNCLPAHFTIEDFERELTVAGVPDGGYLMRTCSYWFDDMKRAYGIDGFCCWDVLVTMYILRPDLFEDRPFDVVLDPRLLGAGYLLPARPGLPQARICLPRIRDAEAVHAEALSTWHAALEALACAKGQA